MADRETKIADRLYSDSTYVTSLGYEVFGVFLQGSQNYEMDYAGSDIDTKCIVLPSAEDIILNRPPVSTTLILEDNSHIDVKDIRLMWQHFKKQNVNYLEILFTKYRYVPLKYFHYWHDMENLKEAIAHIDNHAAVNCIVGMVLEKNKALCHPYPTLKDKIDKYGYDNKQLHHILRCKEFLDRYIAGEPYADCLIPTNKEELVEVKATYKYDLSAAKRLADDTVLYVVHKKQQYINSVPRVIVEDTCAKMDKILVDALKDSWGVTVGVDI